MANELDIVLKSVLTQSINQFNELTHSAATFKDVITTTVKQLDANRNVTGIKTIIKTLDGASVTTAKFNADGQLLSKTLKQTSENGLHLKNALSTMFDLNKIYLYWNLTKRLRDKLKEIVNLAVDYVETENKFNMSMGDAKNDATRFVNQISEAVGIAKQTLMDYQSTFKNILSGLGDFTDIQSEKISESLTKMSLDYSSLFNVGQESAMEKFQAALTGSIRPIRSDSGFDVSDTTIGAKATELGIERTVGQLNQMEKRILRIIVLMDQLRNTGAMGDLARTIESPASQLRVLQQQLKEVGTWLGNVFIGTIGKILPYINGFVMALKEIIKMFAIFVGYQGDNSNLSDVFEAAETSAGGISDGIGKAKDNAKELKKQLMGFEVLNVINSPTENNSSGGAGGGSGLEIDPAILSALGEYDSLMEKVRMKASDIRDKIMDWLGFVKRINPLTGELEWQLKEGYTNFEKILDIVKTIGVAIGTWKLASSTAKFLGTLLGWDDAIKTASMSIATGITLVISGAFIEYKGISHLIDDGADVFTILETALGFGMTTGGFYAILNALQKTGVISTSINKLTLAFSLALVVTAFEIGMKAVEKNDLQLMILSAVVAGAGTALGLMTLGVGTGIVITTTLAIMIGTVILEKALANAEGVRTLKKEVEDLGKDIDNTISSYENSVKSIQNNATTQQAELEYTENLRDKLSALVDENGKVKEGYENRAKYILGELNNALGTEYSLNGNIIQNYKDMQTEIAGIIEEKKKQIELEAYEELYKETIKQNIELQQEQNELQQKRNELIEEHQRIWDEDRLNIVAMHEWNKAWEENNDAIEKCSTALEENTTSMNFYGDKLDELADGTVQATGKITTNVEEMTSTTVEDISKLLSTNVQEFNKKLSEMNSSTKANILAQITTVDNMTPDVVKAWDDLATESIKDFSDAIKMAEPTVAGAILAAKTTTENADDLIEAWLDLGTDSETEFENALKNVDTYTAAKIIAARTNAEGLTESNTRVWKYLSEQADGSYEAGLATVDTYTKDQVDSAISEVNKKVGDAGTAGNNLGSSINSNVQTGLGSGASLVTPFLQSIWDSFKETHPITAGIISAAASLASKITQAFQGNINLNATPSVSGGGGKIGARAGGGPVNVGEMFIAREAGPELVGTIGNTTAVMNNQQIVEAVSRGVAQAVSEVMSRGSGNTTVVNIDGREIARTVEKRIIRNANMYGTN